MSSRPKAVPHVHISEPHVRVTEWRFAPAPRRAGTGTRPTMSSCPCSTATFCSRSRAAARARRRSSGMSLARREGVEHNVINANPYDYAFMEIEHLKP